MKQDKMMTIFKYYAGAVISGLLSLAVLVANLSHGITKEGLILIVCFAVLAAFFVFSAFRDKKKIPFTELKYLGHNSFRLVSSRGTVIYIDPYAGDDEDYSYPADGILVTHMHEKHSRIERVNCTENTWLVTPEEAIVNGEYQEFTIGTVEITAVQAYNENHRKEETVGYVLKSDQNKFYFAGDTGKTDDMYELRLKDIDWAFFPCDGVENMGPEEASECANIVGANINMPVHTDVNGGFCIENAEAFDAYNSSPMKPGKVMHI